MAKNWDFEVQGSTATLQYQGASITMPLKDAQAIATQISEYGSNGSGRTAGRKPVGATSRSKTAVSKKKGGKKGC